MKKYLMTGLFTLTIGGLLTSCTHDEGYSTLVESKVAAYQEVFTSTFGKIDPNQNWGFAPVASAETTTSNARTFTRSISNPTVADISAPFNATSVASFLDSATEVNEANASQNWDGSSDFVLDFKITGTWNKIISVATSEDYNGSRYHRDICVTGTWNINDDQKIGGNGTVIVANGGKINIAQGKTLTFVNQARLVVLQGGTITGAGNIEVTNGNAAGHENYNGGTINITGDFNNNFGKFYNYGTFKSYTYTAGGQESNFYNHGIVHINNAGKRSDANDGAYYKSPNARIFNACQWYCENDMRAFIIEETSGASFIVGGELQMSGGNDGTTDPTYVALAGGAYLEAGQLSNNGTTWYGPTSNGYAVTKFGKIVYFNWAQDTHPLAWGYFANNIYVDITTSDNLPGGNGMQNETAYQKFWSIVANAQGNGNVTEIHPGNTEIIPKSEGFQLGVSGCTPGYKGDTGSITPPDVVPSIPTDNPIVKYQYKTVEHHKTVTLDETLSKRILCEDLGKIDRNDLDFNDVVFDVLIYKVTTWDRTITVRDGVQVGSVDSEVTSTSYFADIVVLAAGGTLMLNVNGKEVHEALGGHWYSTIINTTKDDAGAYSNPWDSNSPVYIGRIEGLNNPASVEVHVKYNDTESMVLTALEGMAPHKIAVPLRTPWAKERAKIDEAYKDFKKYVNESSEFWNGEKDADLIYGDLSYSRPAADEGDTITSTEAPVAEPVSDTAEGGYQEGDPVLSRKK